MTARGTAVEIEVAGEVSAELADDVARLVPQLSQTARPPSRAELSEIVGSPATTLFVARAPGSNRVVGMLTLVMHLIPTGRRAVIEDVVVDETARRLSIGEALVKAALSGAAAYGARSVDLTSRPSREAANRLYLKMGFEQRTTNHYRHSLSGTEDQPGALGR
ncbi:MAG: GNAT family N-acetyltransferase [Acidimicrobiales bacterium]